jgi:phosphatidylglycerophosphate synthase
MGLKSHRNEEKEVIATLPNALTAVRAVGSVALGAALAAKGIDPTVAVGAAAALAASDAEGSVITATKRFPRVQRALRIIPSKFGRIGDPIADKFLGISLMAGGMVGGEIPIWQGASILATEIATAATSVAIQSRGGDVEAPKIGKIGMGARCAVIIADLLASAVGTHSGIAHEVFADGGDALAGAAFALGSLSVGTIIHKHNNPLPQLPAPAPGV